MHSAKPPTPHRRRTAIVTLIPLATCCYGSGMAQAANNLPPNRKVSTPVFVVPF